MVDYGFSTEGAGLIDAISSLMIIVVAVLALASAARYYLVMTLGERVVADLRTAVFAHLTRLDPGLLRHREIRRDRVAAHRRHDADQGGLRASALGRPAQSLPVPRRDRR